MRELRTFSPESKPNLAQIGEYFTGRLQGRQAGISFKTDALGNTQFTSLGFQEATLHEPHAATLVVSGKGRDLLTLNKGLLRRLAAGEGMEKKIGEGETGKVYPVTLETEEGAKPFAVKYIFPIEREGVFGMQTRYTPGVDQMRFMQLLQQEQPLAGLQVAVPVLATMDMTLAPVVENALPLNSLQLVSFIPSSIAKLPIRESDKRSLESISQETMQVGFTSQTFISRFCDQAVSATEGLSAWLQSKIQEGNLDRLSIIERDISVIEPENSGNLIISLDKFSQLYQRVKQDKDFFNPDNSEFTTAVRECCHLVELI